MRKIFLMSAAFAVSAGVASAEGLPGVTDGPGPNMLIKVASADGTEKGTITLDLFDDKAPNHVARLIELAESDSYDDVVFHRVIDGFMAQTGDVEFGKHSGDTSRAGMGGSKLDDLAAEFSDVSFQPGTVGMARSQDPNSANSQFFINLAAAPFLDGEYTVIGQLVDGWDVLNQIKKGDPNANGAVEDPDYIVDVTIEK